MVRGQSDADLLALQDVVRQEIMKRPSITSQMLEAAGVQYHPIPTSQEQLEQAQQKAKESLLSQVPLAYQGYTELGALLNIQPDKGMFRTQEEVSTALEKWLTPAILAYVSAQKEAFHLVVKPNTAPRSVEHFISIVRQLTGRQVPPIAVQLYQKLTLEQLTGIHTPTPQQPCVFELVPASTSQDMEDTPEKQQKKLAELRERNPNVPLRSVNILDMVMLAKRGVFEDEGVRVQLFDLPPQEFGFVGKVVPSISASSQQLTFDSVKLTQTGSTLIAVG